MARKFFTKDYAVYIGVRAASRLFSLLPLSLALRVGEVIGLCMYHFHPKRKRIAYANLKAAFHKDKAPSELKDILRRTYKNYGRNIAEIIRIPAINRGYLKKFISLEGRANFDEAEAKKKGIIFLTSHFGNWEISNLKSAQEGYPIYMLARPQGYDRLNDILNSYRQKLGCKVIERGMPTREMIRALKENKIVGIASDQDVGRAGVYTEFFGRPASHAVGAIRLARDTGATIIPTFIVRKDGLRHVIYLERGVTIHKSEDRNGDIKKGIAEQARILESYVRRYPDQWMWVYTRWKSTPARKVLILSDIKTGHLNQSLAALEVIKRCRRDAGFTDADTSAEIVEVKYRSRPRRRVFLLLSSLLISHRWQGCMAPLQLCLTKDSYDNLAHTYADIIISCGSSLAPVNLFLSRENNAKNVIIMKPGMLGLKGFDVAIIPRHDKPKKAQNVVITEGSPNLINSESMKDGSISIRKAVSLSERKRLGLLLGGDNAEYRLTAELAGRLITQVEGLLKELDTELLLTTSRRTPKDVEALLKDRLGSNSRCKLLVVANERNIENAVSGILDLSAVVLVSGESISMVSEAASSGKKTVVFDLLKKRRSAKHEVTLEGLSRSNYIVRTPIDKVCETVVYMWRSGRQLKRLDDTEKMYEKLYRII